MISDELRAIFDSDDDGLLETPEKPAKVTSSDRLERSFLEIAEFYRLNQRVPSPETHTISERKLGARLMGILANSEKVKALKHLDEFGLLVEPKPPSSIEDLFESDDFGLLEDTSGLFDTSALPTRKAPKDPESVARRKKATDFEMFEPLFEQKQAEIRNGTAKIIPFQGRHTINVGAYFVLSGVMLFVAEVGETEYLKVGGKPERKERLRCIFANGTESSMYKSSLSIRLHEYEGQAVVPTDYEALTEDDEASGYIYVLRSLSDDPQIAGITNLYKIGFSRGPVEKRIANAERQPTYLMAPVEIVATYRTYNMKTSALEHLLHRVFADVRLQVAQVGFDGRTYEPSEWYVAPIDAIDRAVELIASGDIVDYTYDSVLGEIVPLERSEGVDDSYPDGEI